ncbi:MAG: hypothetical protein NC081_07130 [Roseburia sp.]|nr:hypothetical protein [Roseburia sp.]
MSVSVCVGNYAKIPYKIAGLELAVYCMEELCYCMKENAFLLDMTLMNDELVNWIGIDCGLKELAGKLYPLVHRKGSLSSFVTMILEYVGFYDGDVIRQVEQALRRGTGLSGIEKRKTQIDYLVNRKKYVAALRGYDALLAQWTELEREGGELPADKVRASLQHNKGVVFCHLMLYEQAGECFLRAYQLTGDEEEYLAYLAAKRMKLSENDYIAFAAEDAEHYESMLALEKRMERIRKTFEEQEAYERLLRRKRWREGNEKQSYYDDNESLARVLKNSYRECVYD